MVNITTPLLIIGAALPRTGTMSLMAALEDLGYKVYHGTTGFQNTKWRDLWYQLVKADMAINDDGKRKAFYALVEELSQDGFTAILDQPGCFIYQDSMEYYPQAKVLNTKRLRDSWAKSMVEMAYNLDLLSWQPPYSIRPTYII
jgi:hypothetical protein